MTERPLPFEDRSPCEGELFSIEYLYIIQTPVFRARHGHRVSIMRNAETHRLTEIYAAMAEDGVTDELLAEARAREDRRLRALGQMALAFREERFLMLNIPTLPPSLWW